MPYSPLQLAETFIKTGELQDALAALDEHLSQQPDDPHARRLRAALLLRLGGPERWRAALRELDQLTEATPSDYVQRSIIHQRMDDLPAAIADQQRALELAGDDERIAERLTNLLISSGQLEAALELVANQSRTWRWLQWEGDLWALMGDDAEAAARYGLALAQLSGRHLLETDKTLHALRARLLLARGHALRRLGHLEEALNHYQQAQALIPDDPLIDFNIGLVRALGGQLDQAIALCQRAWAQATPALRDQMAHFLAQHPQFSALKGPLNDD